MGAAVRGEWQQVTCSRGRSRRVAASYVQPRPFAKPHLWCFPQLRCYLCSYAGRSLREDIRIKIRASTIFIRISSLAELDYKNFTFFFKKLLAHTYIFVYY